VVELTVAPVFFIVGFSLGGAGMADDLNDRGAQDRARISLDAPHEVRYWTEALHVSEDRLRELVGQVGHSAKAVRDKLGLRD
jgi:hypothetical protein